jgi:hypothetical protein
MRGEGLSVKGLSGNPVSILCNSLWSAVPSRIWWDSLIGEGAPALPSCSCLALPFALSCLVSHAVHARAPYNADVSSSVYNHRVVLLLKVRRRASRMHSAD